MSKRPDRKRTTSARELAEAFSLVGDEFAEAVRLHRQGEPEKAEAAYRSVLKQDPCHADALQLLGMLRHHEGDSSEADRLFQEAIRVDPRHVDAYNNWGNVLAQQGRLEEAVATYRTAIDICPDRAQLHNNLAATLKAQGRLEEAASSYEKAVSLAPDFADAHYNLGIALNALERFSESEESYRRAISLDLRHPHAYRSLARLLSDRGQKSAAVDTLREWLAVAPNNDVAKHYWAALTGDGVPARASDAYVKEMFDEHAGGFEEHLANLDYRGPDVIEQMLKEFLPAADGNLAVLDAGCGTGLCAPKLRPYAKSLIGVDLSEGMLRGARARRIYDALELAELTGFLERNPGEYDLIVSADTLIYFGDLDAISTAAYGALRENGWFIFTVERSVVDTSEPYLLQESGRYTHLESYVHSVLVKAGFIVSANRYVETRKEKGQPVPGLVVLAKKAAR